MATHLPSSHLPESHLPEGHLPGSGGGATLARPEVDPWLLEDIALLLAVFGQAMTYRKRGLEANDRSILAIVDRLGPEDVPQPGGWNAPAFEVVVANDATTGISSSEIDTGSDVVLLDVMIGEGGQERQIVRVMEQDGGALKLWVR